MNKSLHRVEDCFILDSKDISSGWSTQEVKTWFDFSEEQLIELMDNSGVWYLCMCYNGRDRHFVRWVGLDKTDGLGGWEVCQHDQGINQAYTNSQQEHARHA